jgi:hypothetical protein
LEHTSTGCLFSERRLISEQHLDFLENELPWLLKDMAVWRQLWLQSNSLLPHTSRKIKEFLISISVTAAFADEVQKLECIGHRTFPHYITSFSDKRSY